MLSPQRSRCGGVVWRLAMVGFRLDQEPASTEPDGLTDPDSLAKFIRVDISARQARYAMTPIVGLVNASSTRATPKMIVACAAERPQKLV